MTDHDMVPTATAVYDYMVKHRGCSLDEIATGLKTSLSTVNNRVNDLIKQGRAKKVAKQHRSVEAVVDHA